MERFCFREAEFRFPVDKQTAPPEPLPAREVRHRTYPSKCATDVSVPAKVRRQPPLSQCAALISPPVLARPVLHGDVWAVHASVNSLKTLEKRAVRNRHEYHHLASFEASYEPLTRYEGDVPERCRGVPRARKNTVEVRNKRGEISQAVLEIRYARMVVLPPIGKQKNYPTVILSVIHAQEQEQPQGRERSDWKLLTDLPVASRRDAVEKLEWYAQRWKIETFHKVLKSGCKAEESRLRSAERLVNLVTVLCILGWRIFGSP